MKHIFLTIILALLPFFCSAQTYKMYRTQNYHNQLKLNTATGAVTQVQDDGQSWSVVEAIEYGATRANRFALYETQNMWTFIEVDTYTGRLWQVQFSVKGSDYMYALPINTKNLVISKNRSVFTVQPMVSMYQFYLINEETGEMWKFQWSQKGPDYRWIEKM